MTKKSRQKLKYERKENERKNEKSFCGETKSIFYNF